MTCESCGDKPKNTARDFTKAVIEIDNPETLVLLRKVVIPASMGTEVQVPAAIGKYKNVILYYEANKHTYVYSSDGIPTLLEVDIPQELWDRIATLEEGLGHETEVRAAADARLQQELDDFKNSPDVVDIVATHAALEAYDTSGLGDKDVIRVLVDETHDGQSTYYRWNLSSQTWTYIGAVGDYYTKTQTDNLIATAPAFKPFPNSVVTNGTTQEFMNSILALSPEVGMAYLGTVSLSDMPASLVQEEVEVYVYSPYVVYCVMRSADTAPYEWWCSSYNYQGWKASDTVYTAGTNVSITGNVISATDTTYSAFTGTDGVDPGTSGLVPAPAAADAGKVLGANGSWVTGGPSVVQSTGTSTTDVMSQVATSQLIYPQGDETSKNKVRIGGSAAAVSTYSVAIGTSAYAAQMGSVALGRAANSAHTHSIALGDDSKTKRIGELFVGCENNNYGYNNTKLRVIGGVHSPINNDDAATKGYVDSVTPIITLQTTDPGEGAPLAANHFIGVYDA